MIRVVVAAGVSLIGVPTVLLGQGIDGYFVGAEVDLPSSMLERSDDGRFSISLVRSGATPFERQLIVRAESLFPEPGLIDADVTSWLDDFAETNRTMGVWPERFEEAADAPGQRWWWLLGESASWPYAVTGAGVAHYIERVRQLRDSPNPAARHNPGVEHTADFEYAAHITRSERSHYVVELKVTWRYYCGQLCAMGFEHSRRVEFDIDGRLVSVEGDGPPAVWQS